MSTQDRREADRESAWALLERVEDDPVVQSWLRDLDREQPAWRRMIGRRAMIGIAASVLLMLCASVIAYIHFQPLHYETRIGEQRDVVLPDGSRVTLNTDTSLKVRYSKTRRYIELERGEALFTVEHDASWPFDVSAGGTLTRALGTEFNVDVRNSKVTVSVLDGAVRVAAVKQIAGSSVTPGSDLQPGMSTIATALAKGEAVEVRPAERRVIAEKADVRRIDAWRTRRLEFTDTPLADAIDEFNRYSSTPIVIGTPDLAAVRVSGIFRIGDVDGFVFSLEQTLGARTLTSPSEITLVRTAP
jgi:transmembrane sensor